MLAIVVCVGSSCYVRGAEVLADSLDQLIRQHGLQANVEMVGAFCMERCSMGASVRVGDTQYSGVNPQDVQRFFREQVLPRVAQEVER